QSAADLRGALKRLRRDTESGVVAAHSSATRVAPPPRSPRLRRRAFIAAAAILVLGGIYLFRLRSRPPVMAAASSVVLADFSNSTGDTMFDGTLRQALAVDLEQSPYLRLLSDQQMSQAAALMGLKSGTPVAGAVARQMCQRTDSAASLEGSIAQIGNQYSLILNAVNCSNGDNLASVSQVAQGKDVVLSALGKLANAMRGRLGESLASMQKFNTPIEMVTTPSLPALQAYTLGRKALESGDYQGSSGFFQRALSLDPNFAMAEASLGTAEADLNQTSSTAGMDEITKAYALRDKVSQKERLYIVSHYDQYIRGDLLQTISDYRQWEQIYADDAIPYGNSCNIEIQLGQYPQAVADAQAAIRLDPGSQIFASCLINAYWNQGDMAHAQAQLAPAMAASPRNSTLHQQAALLDFLQHDSAALARETAWLGTQPGGQPLLQRLRALQALTSGHYAALGHEVLTATGVNPDGHVADLLLLAQTDVLYGNRGPALAEAAAALKLSRDANTLNGAATIFSMAGDAARAEPLLAELQRRYPTQTLIQSVDLPCDRAWLALAQHRPDQALLALAPAEPYTLGSYAGGQPSYIRGLALWAQGDFSGAATAWQRVARLPATSPVPWLARLQWARSQDRLGRTAAARAGYSDVLAQWQHADADLPVVQAARAEAARLPAH
ncbi:MAG: tetratricopeptide repeat protein, partial [Terriglobales bacterium]